MAFAGFTHEALQFLADLAANNKRAWFAPRKADYERLLKHPLEALCVELAERFGDRDIPLVADPARSPFRIYRDTRFSKDKSPYKPYVSASFPWQGGGPGGYFSLRPGEIYLGGGLWHPGAGRPRRLAGGRGDAALRWSTPRWRIPGSWLLSARWRASGSSGRPPGLPPITRTQSSSSSRT